MAIPNRFRQVLRALLLAHQLSCREHLRALGISVPGAYLIYWHTRAWLRADKRPRYAANNLCSPIAHAVSVCSLSASLRANR